MSGLSKHGELEIVTLHVPSVPKTFSILSHDGGWQTATHHLSFGTAAWPQELFFLEPRLETS